MTIESLGRLKQLIAIRNYNLITFGSILTVTVIKIIKTSAICRHNLTDVKIDGHATAKR